MAVIPSWTIAIAGQKLGDGGVLPRALRCEIGMDGVGALHLDLIVPDGAGLPTVGQDIAVELALGDDRGKVFKGEIDSVRATGEGAAVTAGDGLARLANTFVAGTYADQSAGQIAGDLVQQSGLTAGTLADGPQLKSYVLFPGISALAQLGRLGALAGADLCTDGEGKVHLLTPDDAGASHTFTWGESLLALDLVAMPSARSGVDVWGEGAAGSAGESKSHWLPEELGGIKGQADITGDAPFASDGALRREILHDGALRTGDAVSAVARARAAAVRPVRGAILAVGAPTVAPGDAVSLSGLPSGHPLAQLLGSRSLRVRRVRHRFDTASGFTTRMEF